MLLISDGSAIAAELIVIFFAPASKLPLHRQVANASTNGERDEQVLRRVSNRLQQSLAIVTCRSNVQQDYFVRAALWASASSAGISSVA
jgi:hypothetical protein